MLRLKRGLALLLCILSIAALFPYSLWAQEKQDEEKMMWRGTINMETTRRHQYQIGETLSGSTWRHATKNEVRTQKASVQIQAADILYSGDIEAEGTTTARVRHQNRSGFRKRDGKWSLNKSFLTGEGHASISGEMIKISIAKQANIDAAPNIEQALMQCGGNPECLENALKMFTGLLEDNEKSFPVKIVAMSLQICDGPMKTTEISQSYTPREGTKTTTDGPHLINGPICRPMAFEMDGTYTRGDRGDTITATFNKTEKTPYKAYNGKDYPIQTTATCTIHLSNGPPEVRIYAIAKEGEQDITDKETNIMIGQRVALSAHVVSYGLGHETSHEWDVKGRVFDQYWACQDEATFEGEVDLDSPVLHFAWAEGSTAGTPRKVIYKATFGDKELEGETTFKVFNPTYSDTIRAANSIDFGWEPDPKDPNKGSCELIPGSPSFSWKSNLSMPRNNLDIYRFCVAYVQKVKQNVWALKPLINLPGNFMWHYDQHGWLLDTSFPYTPAGGPRCVAHSITDFRMQDTPGGSFNIYDAWYIDQEFETYLFFMPPYHPDLVVVPQYVPLKKVAWAWKGSGVAPNPPGQYSHSNCGRGMQKGCQRPPRRCRFEETDFPPHPLWDGYTALPKFKQYRIGANPINPNAAPPAASGWSCSCSSTP